MSRNRPAFTVSANGVTVAVKATWSCRIEDGVGLEGDRMELTLDASDDYEWPRIGAELEIAMGYADDDDELDVMGSYFVDGVKLTGLPWALSVTGHAGDLATKLSEHRARAWVDLTMGEIAQDIADVADVQVRVSDELRDRRFGYVEQKDESDLDVLTRLARRLNVVARPIKGGIVIARKQQAKSVRGTTMGEVTIKRDQFLRCDLGQSSRGGPGAITCKLRPLPSGRDVSIVGPGPLRFVTFGKGKPKVSLPKVYLDKEQAKQAADAYRFAHTAGVWTLRGAIVGNTRVVAEMAIKTPDLHPDVPTAWSCTRVTHTIDSGGYVTDFEAESVVTDGTD